MCRAVNNFLFCVTVCILLTGGRACAGSFQGELGQWETSWLGVGISKTQTNGLPPYCTLVIDAFEHAQKGNLYNFCSEFIDVSTNRLPDEIRDMYQEWGTDPKRNVFMITSYAVLLSDDKAISNGWAAVSIAPVVMEQLASGSERAAKARARVLFCRHTDADWKLVLQEPDDKLFHYLLAESERVALGPRSPEEVRGLVLQQREDYLKWMKERKSEPEAINAQIEIFDFIDSGSVIDNWSSWAERYHAEVLNPPITFDIRDPSPKNFSSPIKALQSYMSALYAGDAATLLKYADETGRRWLTGHMRVDETRKKASYEVFPKLTKVTVLLKATTKLQGREYILLLYRREAAENPKDNVIFLNAEVFRREKNEYFLSADMDSSPFIMPIYYSGVEDDGLYLYPTFFERFKKSAFPRHFFTIE